MTVVQGILAKPAQIQLKNGAILSYVCWNPQDTTKPPALLSHGTGFVWANFSQLAQHLCCDFRVFAYDRRGHGHSCKPERAYALKDFADDCLAFCEALDLQAVFGVGHSAGATDLLIAESLVPGTFAKLFVMEPTINDPNQKTLPLEQALMNIQPRIDQALKRRATFPSRQVVLENYRHKPLFERWQSQALKDYIHYGFEELNDGSVRLRCEPEIEAKILKEIFFAFQNVGFETPENDPFAQMHKVICPMAVSESSLSGPQFRQLVERALAHFPQAQHVLFKDTGHCVPQENPEALANEVINFWRVN